MNFCEGGSHADFWRCWGSNATKYSPQLAFLLEKIEKDVNCPFRKSFFFESLHFSEILEKFVDKNAIKSCFCGIKVFLHIS